MREIRKKLKYLGFEKTPQSTVDDRLLFSNQKIMPRGLNVPRKWKKINQKSKTCLNTVLRVLLLENNAYLFLKYGLSRNIT